ncbi:MAG: ABC transporter ATP-binding protein [Candidatus Hydrothermarchaeota archaeon]
MLEVENIDVHYGNIQVLWGVSFRVYEGEVVSIIGSNGAGKTTIINTLLGILKPTTGRIKFLNEEISKLPTYSIVKKGISLVPEGRSLFPNLKVIENLLLGAYTIKDDRKVKEILDWVFEIFPVLEERKNQLAGTLSGGEQQMLAIARSLMLRPKFLILDEPSLGLAPIMVHEVYRQLERLNREGVTILLSEQNVFQSLELADRGYVLESGRIIMEGKGKELLKNDHIKEAYLGM